MISAAPHHRFVGVDGQSVIHLTTTGLMVRSVTERTSVKTLCDTEVQARWFATVTYHPMEKVCVGCRLKANQ